MKKVAEMPDILRAVIAGDDQIVDYCQHFPQLFNYLFTALRHISSIYKFIDSRHHRFSLERSMNQEFEQSERDRKIVKRR
jgi:hypothetical protein